MYIAIVDWLGSPYDGSTLAKRGLGGSESAVISIARELVKLGMTVHVYNDCTNLDAAEGEYDGVEYRDRNNITVWSEHYDLLISSRSVLPFVADTHSVMAHKKVLWMHDTFTDYDDRVENLLVNGVIDELWTLSDFHTQYLLTCNHGNKRMGEVLKRKVWQTRNGINLYSDYIDIAAKNAKLFVWNAATNKGLRTLLEDVWPRVRQHVPDAVLAVIGGYYKLNVLDVQHKEWSDLKEDHDMENGVAFTDVVTQEVISSVLTDASFFIYPQSLPETYGISTLEAQAYGCTPITGRFGALEEIATEDGSYLTDYPVDSNPLYQFNKAAHVEAFLQSVLKAYDDQYLWMQKANACLKVRDVATWDKVAVQWKQHIYKLCDEYLPVDQYRAAIQISQRYREIFNTRWLNDEDKTVWSSRDKNIIRVIVPFRNASAYIEKCILSIAAQDYEDYYFVDLIDDASTDDTVEVVERVLSELPKCLNNMFELSKNTESVGALANQMSCVKYMHHEIVVLVDGDDWLANDPNIFNKISRLYQDGAMMTYGSCHSVVDNIPLIAQEYPPEVKKKKSYREHKFAWNIPYTHLRTFKGSLANSVDDFSLRDTDGRYYRAGGDAALLYALLEAADPSTIRVVRDIWYHYNDANPVNDYKVNSEEQNDNAGAIVNYKKNKKILIAIPTAQNIHPETFRSIYNLEVPDGYETEFQYFYGYCIDQVRNLIAQWVVDGYDYLFAVDYDMSFPADTLKRLLAHDIGIVSGTYRQRKSELVYEAYMLINGSGEHANLKTVHPMLQPASAVGFGCCLVKKQVFKDVGYPYFTYHHALKHENTKSEDIDFCEKAYKKGWSTYLDGTIQCSHHGQTTYELPPLRPFDPTNE